MIAIKGVAKRILFSALGNEFVIRRRLEAIKASGRLLILNLHRVSEEDGSAYRPLNPILFEELLIFMKRHFELTTFDCLDQRSSTARAILSFDDGYKDFIEIACPMLHKHKVRVNQNIIPQCVEKQLPPLNVLAQDFVGKAPRKLVEKLTIPGFRESGGNLGHRLSSFIKNKPHTEQEQLAEVLLPQFFRWDDFAPTKMMTCDEVREVAEMHEVGGHSYSHASMAMETDDYLRNDLLLCQQYFNQILNQPMNIYALPNGCCRDEQIAIIRNSGVEHVLLVGEDFDNGSFAHHRFTFDAGTMNEARFRALGKLKRI